MLDRKSAQKPETAVPRLAEPNMELGGVVGLDSRAMRSVALSKEFIASLLRLLNGPVTSLSRLIITPADPVVCLAAVVGQQQALVPDTPGSRPRLVSGRGTTVTQAFVGCLAEAAERYSATFHGTEDMLRATASELGSLAVEPESLLHFSRRQYRTRRQWNTNVGPLNVVPARLRRGMRLDWLQVDRASSTRNAWLPACCCLLGYENPAGDRFWLADSNGCAAGITLEEAATRAFLELVERDAVAIWWYNQLRTREIPLAVAESSIAAKVGAWLLDRGRRLTLLSLSYDFPVEVVAALSTDGRGGMIALGFGSAWSIHDAVDKAVTELVQSEISLLLIARNARVHGPKNVDNDALALLRWHRSLSTQSQPQLEPRGHVSPGRDRPRGATDLGACHAICRDRGLDLLVLNLTRESIGIPAARVVVPSLRPLWARFGQGRLYDVPIRLGWLDKPKSERELNQEPIPF